MKVPLFVGYQFSWFNSTMKFSSQLTVNSSLHSKGNSLEPWIHESMINYIFKNPRKLIPTIIKLKYLHSNYFAQDIKHVLIKQGSQMCCIFRSVTHLLLMIQTSLNTLVLHFRKRKFFSRMSFIMLRKKWKWAKKMSNFLPILEPANRCQETARTQDFAPFTQELLGALSGPRPLAVMPRPRFARLASLFRPLIINAWNIQCDINIDLHF